MAEKNKPLKKAVKDAPDAETYVALAREKASPSGKILERVQAVNRMKVDSLASELEVAQLENAVKSVKGVSPAQAESLAAQILKGRSAEEIKEILQTLTPDMLVKLQALSQATDPVAMAMKMQQQQQPTQAQPQRSEGQLLLDTIRVMNEMKPKDELTPILLKALLEQRAAPQGGGAMEVIRLASELNKPVLELMGRATDTTSRKDKEIMDLKLKEMEAKMPQDPIETIKYVKEMSGALGLGNARNEYDLKLEEMRQNRDIDMKRLDWEEKKYEMEAEADSQKWEQISRILEGPVGKALQGIGNAGADRVRGKPNVKTPKIARTLCPNCEHEIFVDADADSAICGSCGATLQKGMPEPPPPQPPPAPPSVNPNQVQPEPKPEEDDTPEEEDDNESDETEGEDEQKP